MTRLITQDIANISSELERFDSVLREKTGRSLLGVACHAAGIVKNPTSELIASLKVNVVPMTCGQGIIEGFSEAVESILAHIGFKAFVTQNTDASGVAEAFENNVDILMMADDRRFVALVLKSCCVIDNAVATGKGFAAALDLMTEGLKGQKALVIGCGPVGQSAAETLIHFGARVSVYDINQKRCGGFAEQTLRSDGVIIVIETSLEQALNNHRFVIEATNSADVIGQEYLRPEIFISAPGMPLGISVAAYKKAQAHILHDPLQTGVATMGLMALKACYPLEFDKGTGANEQ